MLPMICAHPAPNLKYAEYAVYDMQLLAYLTKSKWKIEVIFLWYIVHLDTNRRTELMVHDWQSCYQHRSCELCFIPLVFAERIFTIQNPHWTWSQDPYQYLSLQKNFPTNIKLPKNRVEKVWGEAYKGIYYRKNWW